MHTHLHTYIPTYIHSIRIIYTQGSADQGAEFSREPSTAQSDIFLHTTIGGNRFYLKSVSGGDLSLVDEATKKAAKGNVQETNKLLFDIVAVKKSDVQ